MYLVAASVIVGYLIGSIPTGVLIGRFVGRIDVRGHGSGSSGATNVVRVLGRRFGLAVAALDIAKGWAATALALRLLQTTKPTTAAWGVALAGMAAVTGHVWPLFAGLRGGKGVATTAGVALALEPTAFAVGLGIFAVVALIARRASVASLAAVVTLPATLAALSSGPAELAFGGFAAALALLTHRSNIHRLVEGREPRF